MRVRGFSGLISQEPTTTYFDVRETQESFGLARPIPYVPARARERAENDAHRA